MANTDRAGTMKRSRGADAEKETTKSTKKRKKQKNQSKNKQKNKIESSKPQEVTATPQGQEMAQVLSTLNRLEQSRLEAFRRATLPSNALSDYLAHCLLLHEEQLRNCGRLQQKGGLLLSDSDKSVKLPRNLRHHRRRPLSDLVAPGHADSIVLVVSSLAKTYAQRLVAAARRVADSEDWPQDKALAPHHLEQARAARIRAGVDPGFWMQSEAPFGAEAVSESVKAAALGKVDRRKLLRQAALQAQEDYDNFLKTGQTVNLLSPSSEKETNENSVKVDETSTNGTGSTNAKDKEDVVMKETSTTENESSKGESKNAENNNEESNKRKDTESEIERPNKRSKPNIPEPTTKEEDKVSNSPKKKEILKVPSSSELPLLDDPLDVKEKPIQALPDPVPAPVLAPTPAPTLAPAAPVPKPTPAPKPASSAPMSMEDALLNDLDDDSSDDDD